MTEIKELEKQERQLKEQLKLLNKKDDVMKLKSQIRKKKMRPLINLVNNISKGVNTGKRKLFKDDNNKDEVKSFFG